MQRKKAATKQNAADELRIRIDTTAPPARWHALPTTCSLFPLSYSQVASHKSSLKNA